MYSILARMTPYPYCICAPVSEKALQALLEASGRGTFKDEHPWLVARELLEDARSEGSALPILFAVGPPSQFSHWGFIEALEVLELHRGSWQTACSFSPLQPVNPIWSALDSLLQKPSGEQLRREALEGIHQHRHALTEGELRPYAICETPAFILAAAE
jgi:hypothetical protein